MNYLEYSSFHIFKSTVSLEDKVLEVEFCVKEYMHLCLKSKSPSIEVIPVTSSVNI